MLEQLVYIVTTALLSFEWSNLIPAIIRIFYVYEEYVSFKYVIKFY